MTRTSQAVTILALLCSAPLAVGGEATALTGRQIAEKARREGEGNNERIDIEMQLAPKDGRTVTRRFVYETLKVGDGLSHTLIRFSYPRRMKDTGLLTLEQQSRDDDQWLYLPSLRRVRRIASDAKTERFVQSDFTYEDLQSEDLDDNTYKVLGTETVGDRPCHIIEATPKGTSGYSRRVIAVDAERWIRLRVLYYAPDGELAKTQTETGVRKHGDRYWRPDRIEMVDHIRRHTTVFVIHGREINKGIPADHFTQRYLKSGH